MPQQVQRCLVIEADRFRNERISGPFADGITQPTGLRVWRKCSTIVENLAKYGFRFVQDHHYPGRLDNLEWSRYKALKRNSGQWTKRWRACRSRRSLRQLRAHLRPHRFLAGGIVGKEVEEILRRQILPESVNAAGKQELPYLLNGRALTLPDSREIRFAIEAGRGRGQIRFAVPRPWNYRIVIHRPLRVNENRHGDQHREQP